MAPRAAGALPVLLPAPSPRWRCALAGGWWRGRGQNTPSRSHLVATHFSPASTGAPPCSVRVHGAPVVAEEHRVARTGATSRPTSGKVVAPPRSGVFRYITSVPTRWPPRCRMVACRAARGRSSRGAACTRRPAGSAGSAGPRRSTGQRSSAAMRARCAGSAALAALEEHAVAGARGVDLAAAGGVVHRLAAQQPRPASFDQRRRIRRRTAGRRRPPRAGGASLSTCTAWPSATSTLGARPAPARAPARPAAGRQARPAACGSEARCSRSVCSMRGDGHRLLPAAGLIMAWRRPAVGSRPRPAR
jgi:hypothetical protein